MAAAIPSDIAVGAETLIKAIQKVLAACRKPMSEHLILTICQQVHFLAVIELQSQKTGNPGSPLSMKPDCYPGIEIFQSIMRRSSILRVFGQYDSKGIILEPAGYLCMADKANLV